MNNKMTKGHIVEETKKTKTSITTDQIISLNMKRTCFLKIKIQWKNYLLP